MLFERSARFLSVTRGTPIIGTHIIQGGVEFLGVADIGYFILGCVDKDVAYVIPHADMSGQLSNLNKTSLKTEGSIGIFIWKTIRK